MHTFTISVADIAIRIRPIYPEIQSFFQDYLSTETPCFEIAACEQDLEKEQRLLEKRYATDSFCPPLPESYYEKLAVFRMIANRIPDYDAMLFHGSAIATEGKAYLFVAPSGTGKTTHTLLWLAQLPDAHFLNDDKPFMKLASDGQILACGTPWHGKEGLGRNEILPLEAICLLKRAAENRIQRISAEEAIDSLMRHAHMPGTPAAQLKTIRLLDGICRGVKLYRLGCNMDPDAAELSIRAMVRKNI